MILYLVAQGENPDGTEIPASNGGVSVYGWVRNPEVIKKIYEVLRQSAMEDGIGEVKSVPFTESDLAFMTEKKAKLRAKSQEESDNVLDSLLGKVSV
jgi:hypothetical protein